MEILTKTRNPWHFDTISQTIRQQSNAIDIRPAIASRPKACKPVQRDNDVKRRDNTGSASMTFKAVFSIWRCNNWKGGENAHNSRKLNTFVVDRN